MIPSLMLPRRKCLIPLVLVSEVSIALEFAKRWEGEGNTHIEILLRTPEALAATEAISNATSLVVAAGTIITPQTLRDARNAGAHFGITPGLETAILNDAETLGFPLVPGVLTPSEIMIALARGFTTLKLFPASRFGGVHYLRDLAAVFAGVDFIPSGGLTAENHQEYLALDNVCAVGGRWMVPKH